MQNNLGTAGPSLFLTTNRVAFFLLIPLAPFALWKLPAPNDLLASQCMGSAAQEWKVQEIL